jgi:ABC-type multidrug transport system ATPase subunit
MLSINHLSKTYPNGVKAMQQIELSISPGMFGLLGPNGAGKSTLMRTLATLQDPDSGSILFNEIDVLANPMRLRKVLGYLPQEFGVYPGISAEKLLNYLATLKGIASKKERNILVQKVLEITNLYEDRKKQVSTYSGGMKQRFGIAQLLLNQPKLIIVDEPTAGLDPAERQRFLNILREISTENTIIFSTHIVDDVKDLCREMAILNNGCLLLQDNPIAATQQLDGQIWVTTIQRNELEATEANFQVLSSSYNPDHSLEVRVFAQQCPAPEFETATPELEDVYFLALQSNS